MRSTIASFQRFTALSFFAAAFCVSGLASTSSSISATAGSNSCGQTGAGGLTCSVTNGTANASGLTIATFDSPGGRLEATSNADGPSTSAAASISYSNFLIVTGASGSGELAIEVTGFQDPEGSFPGASTISPLTVTLGSNSAITIFPFTPGAMSVVLPVTFGTVEELTLSFSDTATGTLFQGGVLGHGNGDAVVFAGPTFGVNAVTGLPIPGATVEFVPEPGDVGLVLSGMAGMWWLRGRTRRVRG